MTRIATYVGMCVGGPMKGKRLETYQPTYQLARMGPMHRPYGLYDEFGPGWQEIDRGHYEFDCGHWWWKGWVLKR